MRAAALWKSEAIIREEKVEIVPLPLQWASGEGREIKIGEGSNQVGSLEFTSHPKSGIQEGGNARWDLGKAKSKGFLRAFYTVVALWEEMSLQPPLLTEVATLRAKNGPFGKWPASVLPDQTQGSCAMEGLLSSHTPPPTPQEH